MFLKRFFFQSFFFEIFSQKIDKKGFSVNITLCFSLYTTFMHSAYWLSTVSLVDDRVVDIGSRSPTCKSSENEGCLNAVGHCVVILTSVCGLVCSYRFPLRHELRWRLGATSGRVSGKV